MWCGVLGGGAEEQGWILIEVGGQRVWFCCAGIRVAAVVERGELFLRAAMRIEQESGQVRDHASDVRERGNVGRRMWPARGRSVVW